MGDRQSCAGIHRYLPAWLLVPGLLLPAINLAQEEDAGIHRHRQVQTDAAPFAIHDEQLRETMSRLNALVSYSEQPEMPLSKDSRQFLQELIDTVGVVADSAQQLRRAEKRDHLGEEQLQIYNTLADQLYNEAVNIDMNAKQMNIRDMNEAFVNLNQVCIACHSLFRSL